MTYVDEVVALLSAEFGWEPYVEEACRNCLLRELVRKLPPKVEFICDSPASANWRLKANPQVDRWALRMAYYGAPGNTDAEARATSITDRLVELVPKVAPR